MTPAESADATCPTCGGPMGRINGRAPRCRLGHTEERESLGNRWANCNRECDGDHAYTEPCNNVMLRALVAVGTHRPCGVEWSDGEAHLCDVDRRAAHAWHVCKCGVMYRRAW